MAVSTSSRRTVRFGVFEADLRSGELRKSGTRIKLQEQPFQVLGMLLERPGDVVTRDELRQKLWPADTFVDFDDGLNTAVKKLRDTLGDSADTPRFIETLPKRGYRFIAPVNGRDESTASVIPVQPAPIPPTAATPPWRSRALKLGLLGAVVVLGVLLGMRTGTGDNPALAPVRSIAVLPLENLSGDPSQEYLADGLTDALTTNLAQTAPLRVISRTSAMNYKGKRKPVQDIARELNVDALVEGSVVRSGERIRVSAQLIHAATDQHLWAQSYERDVADLLALQDEIAQSVAREIRVQLNPEQRRSMARLRSADPQAYDHYLRGRFYSDSKNPAEFEISVREMEQAVALDPGFAPAWAQLARGYSERAFWSRPQESQWAQKATQAVEKALSADPDLPEAHLARANVLWTRANRFPHEKAIAAEKRALALNPNLDEAHHLLGMKYLHLGLFEKGEREMQTALTLNPANVGVRYRLAVNQLYQGNYQQAAAGLMGTRGYIPSLWTYQMATALFHLGKKEEAAALLNDYLKEHPMDEGGVANALLALIAADAGDHARAQAFIRTAIEKGKDFGHFHHTAFTIGEAYARMHRPADAVKWLKFAAEDGFPCYPLYARDPNLDGMRSDPQFVVFMSTLRKQWEHYRATL
ncbi:MAG TPA: winged helix-turn-helix domain-containing protein [Terriglobales bacterium]|nr:winged helix-turn-helix domain-containing protein [Terriglobales bacterium]